MSLKRNTSVTGFTVGLIAKADGSAVTTGTPAAYVTIDGGTQTAISGSLTHEGNGQWSFDLTAGEMDGDIIGIVVTHADAIPVNYTIKTDAATAGDLATAIATVDSIVDAILVDTDSTLPAAIAGCSTHSTSDVVTAMQAVSGDFKADVSALATAANLATLSGKVVGTIAAGTHNPQSGDVFAQLPTNFGSLQITTEGVVSATAGGTITITPVVATVSAGQVVGGDVTIYQFTAPSYSWPLVDSAGNAVNVSGHDLRFIAYNPGTGVKAFELSTEISVGGVDGNEVTVAFPDTVTQAAQTYHYAIRDMDDDLIYAKGTLEIEQVPDGAA